MRRASILAVLALLAPAALANPSQGEAAASLAATARDASSILSAAAASLARSSPSQGSLPPAAAPAPAAAAAALPAAGARSALIVVDTQPCFMEGGSLAVAGGADIVPVVNALLANSSVPWDLVIFTQDWHPPAHISFASTYEPEEAKEYLDVTLQYAADGRLCNLTPELLVGWESMPEREALLAGQCRPLRPAGAPASGGDASQPMVQTRATQTLWPDHCIQGTAEAELHPDLAYDPEQHVLVQKGTSPHLDGYSALYDNGYFSATAVPGLLRDSNITDVFVVGLALDYCVQFTASHCVEDGLRTHLVLDATRAVAPDTGDLALSILGLKGVQVVSSQDLLAA